MSEEPVTMRTADDVISLAVQTARLRDLVTDVVAAAFDQPAPAWLTDELWDRLISEAPTPDAYRRTQPTDDQEALL
jgi:hypothetical protein